MNSQPLGHIIKTSCKDCIFAEYNGITQHNCAAGRLDKFRLDQKVVEAYDIDKEFYVIDRLCNMRRSNSWNGGVLSIDKAMSEIATSFRIYINCSDVNTKNIDKLSYFISNLNYYQHKYKIFLYHHHDSNKILKENLIKLYKLAPSNIYLSSCTNLEEYVHASCLKQQNCYLIKFDISENIESDILNKINNIINIDLKTPLVIKYNNIYSISSTMYKIENLNNQITSYDETKNIIINNLKDTKLYIEL